jgi:hypothetical protein
MLAKNDCKLSINEVDIPMNSKHTKTLRTVFKLPTSGTLEWQAIESLLVAVGCDVIEGSGSRVRFVRDGIVASFHRPHPEKEAKRYQVRDARDYLTALGEEP